MWKKIFRWIRIVFYTVLLVLAVMGGMYSTLYIGKIAEVNVNRPCIVYGYETVSCTRQENETQYLYTVVAQRGNDLVLITYQVSKLRKIYL